MLVLGAVLFFAARLTWAFVSGWQVIGDSAVFLVRSWDVGTRRTPLVGMPTGWAASSGATYHPGPILFWILAPFVRLLGLRTGGFLGSAAIQFTAWAIGIRAGWRAIGDRGALLAFIALSMVSVFGGWGIIWEPDNFFPAIPAAVAAILAAWAVSLGIWQYWPLVILMWSVATEGYLGLTAVSLVPLIWSSCVVITAAIGGHARARRSIAIGVGVFLACWIGPIIDVIANDGGNARLLLANQEAGERSFAGALATVVKWCFAVPPTWARTLDAPRSPDARAYLGSLGWSGFVVVAAFAAVIAARWKLTSRAFRHLTAMTALTIVAAAFTLSRLPRVPGGIWWYQLVWLQLTGACVAITGLLLVIESTRGVRAEFRAIVRTAGTAALVMAVLTWALANSGSLESFRFQWAHSDRAFAGLRSGLLRVASNDRAVMLLPIGRTSPTLADAIASYLIVNGQRVYVPSGRENFYGPTRVPPDGGVEFDALMLVDGAAPGPWEGEVVARWEPPSYSATRMRDVVRRVSEFARRGKGFSLGAGDRPAFVSYLVGTPVGSRCSEVGQIARARDLGVALPDYTIARMYVDGVVSDPPLPRGLRSELLDVWSTRPVEIRRIAGTKVGRRPRPEALLAGGTHCDLAYRMSPE